MKLKFITLLFPLLIMIGCESPATKTGNSGSNTNPGNTGDTLHYVAIGASDAVGYGAVPETNGYVYLIRDELGDYAKNVSFNNLGKSGNTVYEMIDLQLEDAVNLEPDLITIWAGGNDFIDIMKERMTYSSFDEQLNFLVFSLRDFLPNTEIIIANLPDLSELPEFDNLPHSDVLRAEQLIIDMNSAISEVAESYGAELVDFYESAFISDRDNLSDDDFHPSNSGYRIMADLFMDCIDGIY